MSKERFLEKEKILLRWLLLFDYTNRKLVSKLLGVSDGALSQFYRALNRSGLISVVRDPISISSSVKLIVLTKSGFERALTINDDFDIDSLVLKRHIPTSMVRHNLVIQSVLLDSGVDSFSVLSEKIIKKKFSNVQVVPDAIIAENGVRVGLEIELTRKKPNRVYYKFQQQIGYLNSSSNIYEKVYWFFESESLLANYKRIFDQEKWPLVDCVNSRYFIKESSDSDFCFVPSDFDRDKFKFLMV